MGRQYLKQAAGLSNQKTSPSVDVSAVVKEVIDTIRTDGDAWVRKFSEKFDKWSPQSFKLSQADIDAAMANCPKQTLDDIKEVQQNVRAFAEAQKKSLQDFEIEIRPGVHLGQKNVPIDNVGAYVSRFLSLVPVILTKSVG
jgi:histidinol dehydrogenase